jgi:hypothetical protein
MEGSLILPIWQTGGTGQAGGTGALTGLLAEDVTFSSPVADYHGRENAAHLLSLIATVLDDVEPGRGWGGGPDRLTAFTARVDGAELQGILLEERGPAGELVHVTLFLRPQQVLRAAIAKMRQRLADSPLPRTA